MAWADLAGNELPSGAEVNEAITASSLPGGATPSLTTGQVDPTPGATVSAAWTNPGGASGLSIQIEWQRNGSTYLLRTLAPGSTGDSLDTTPMSPGDGVRARIRYRAPTGGLVGSGVVGGAQIRTNAELNAGLVLSSPLAPSNALAAKDEILAAAVTIGTYGAFSNSIFLS